MPIYFFLPYVSYLFAEVLTVFIHFSPDFGEYIYDH